MDRLSAMETFVRVVDTGSFSAAARILNIGQPAVSKSVAQLEEYLGGTCQEFCVWRGQDFLVS
jgi:DNA-binding transcriptional LysR family regulator